MADEKCAVCGSVRDEDAEDWSECEECGASYCPSCEARLEGGEEADVKSCSACAAGGSAPCGGAVRPA
jgi:hypothetical protein